LGYSEFNTKVNISISALTEQRVVVLVTATRQDNYPVVGEVSLLDVLSLAGGTIVWFILFRINIGSRNLVKERRK
jgi:hypothetical protein